MHSKSEIIEHMLYGSGNEIVDKIFESLFSRYQTGLKTSMRGSDFDFDSFQLLYYKFHKINSILIRSYVDSPGFMKRNEQQI